MAVSLGRLFCVAAFSAYLGLCPAVAEETERPPPAFISIIIDDMGYRLRDGLKALDLPGPLAFSFLPNAPHAKKLARLAVASNREILLHLPMEALYEQADIEPGTLTLEMDREQLQKVTAANIASIPGVVGVNNHMGSRLTRETLPMAWLMETLSGRGLFFVDSRTIADSVAASVARQHAVPALSRDVFLDNIQERRYIRRQFFELLLKARRNGTSLGIAHPRPFTLDVLAHELDRIESTDVKLISLAEMLEHRQGFRIARLSASLGAIP